MRLHVHKLCKSTVAFAGKYSIVIGAIVIYVYYLILTLDLFADNGEKRELLGLILQFDSLFLLWGVVYVVVQLQKYRTVRKQGEEQSRNLLRDFQRQQLQLNSLDDISDMLNDRINNPLSMISISAGLLRERMYREEELAGEVEKIESALKRVQEVMMGIQSYHTKKIVKISRQLIEESLRDPKGSGENEGEGGWFGWVRLERTEEERVVKEGERE